MANERRSHDILITFTGKVERIDETEGIAHVTLVDDKGQESYADLAYATLAKAGIKYEGARFVCKIISSAKTNFIPRVERRMPAEEWQKICERIDRENTDDDLSDDE